MNPLVARLYGFFVLLCFVVLAVWLVFDWQQKESVGIKLGRSQLSAVATQLAGLEKTPSGASPVVITNLLKSGLLGDPRWKVVELTSTAHGLEYYWGPPPVTPLPTTTSANDYVLRPEWSRFPLTQVATQVHFGTLKSSEHEIRGIYEFYGPSEVFELLKILGFFLLGLMTITSFVLVISAINSPEPSSIRNEDPREETSQTLERLLADDEEFSNLRNLDDLDTLRDLDTPISVELEKSPASDTSGWQEHTLDAESVSSHHPQELLAKIFSPETLQNELIDHADSGRDLCLAIVSAPLNTNLHGALQDFFGPPSEVFSEASQRWVIILKDWPLEKSLKKLKEFINLQAPSEQVFAGISARCGRTLTPASLMGEAERALRRAQTLGKPVIGLKLQPLTT